MRWARSCAPIEDEDDDEDDYEIAFLRLRGLGRQPGRQSRQYSD